ncbi:MAG TPA: N-acetyltransferase, partial [Nitrospiraceae bacterium]|nr:N-acetyltransferase [Nitrospiraceae bacterium]
MSAVDQLIVRPARPADVDVLVNFSAAMAMETEGRTLDMQRLRRGILAVIESPARGFYLVAEVPAGPLKVVVGQLLVTFEWSDWRNAQFWWIQSVYVDPARRRKGIYRRMHESVLTQARAQGDVCGVRLYVEEGNEAAQVVYRRVGLSRSSYQVFEHDFVLPQKELKSQF